MRRIDANNYELWQQEVENRKKSYRKALKKQLSTKKGKKKYKQTNNTDKRAVAKEYAASLIANATEAEKQLYKIMTAMGIEFKFQHPIYNKDKDGVIKNFYIADFYLPKSNTVIEVDGGYHLTAEQLKKDNSRTESIKMHHSGVRVMRIKNSEVMDGIKVMNFLKRVLDREKSKQLPS